MGKMDRLLILLLAVFITGTIAAPTVEVVNPPSPVVRLVNGSTIYEGRVEMFAYDAWGTVCGLSWDMNEARVICRQLGYGPAISASGAATYVPEPTNASPTEPPYYDCSSYEWQCYYNGECIQDYQRCNGYSDCYYNEDEYNCFGNAVAPTVDVNSPCSVVRLVNGDTIYEGRVEVFVNGSWGTVCDHGWAMREAQVVCRQLGYGPAIRALDDAAYGQGVGPINLVHAYCSGWESSILDCQSYFTDHCFHSEDAGVKCSGPATVRLVNGGASNEGRVEVYHQGEWGTVCDDGWGLDDANVICRMLGFPAAFNAWHGAHFGQGSGGIILDDVNCQGYESSIAECQHNGWFSHDCGHYQDAGVTCESGVRLVNGSSLYEGRVELIVNGVWRTPCSNTWSIGDASVTCKQLGFGSAISALRYAPYGPGIGLIVNLHCYGWENSILDCQSSTSTRCDSGEVGGVVCSANHEIDWLVVVNT
ncbi:deleted in malignant brain tumors 1 protein-like [Patiria miniata]|uniref:SRCR domain-containing protein n=1 Tax=Patiria miniata TaxID=46514 RepID=A0A914ACP5_PATMI|nr:deleted in malignant brain tumors 1 protein-like [Patiria miniata]